MRGAFDDASLNELHKQIYSQPRRGVLMLTGKASEMRPCGSLYISCFECVLSRYYHGFIQL
jgi:hypothetical protein